MGKKQSRPGPPDGTVNNPEGYNQYKGRGDRSEGNMEPTMKSVPIGTFSFMSHKPKTLVEEARAINHQILGKEAAKDPNILKGMVTTVAGAAGLLTGAAMGYAVGDKAGAVNGARMGHHLALDLTSSDPSGNAARQHGLRLLYAAERAEQSRNAQDVDFYNSMKDGLGE